MRSQLLVAALLLSGTGLSAQVTLTGFAQGPPVTGYAFSTGIPTGDPFTASIAGATGNIQASSFLTVSAGGYSPAQVQVIANPSSLNAGTYSGTLVLTDLNTNSTTTQAINFQVLTASPQLSVTPSVVVLSENGLGRVLNGPLTQPVFVENSGGGALPYTVSIVDNPAPAFLSVTPLSGTTSSASPGFTITANPTPATGPALTTGAYYATVRVTSGSMTQDIHVVFLKRPTLLYFSSPTKGLYFTAQAMIGTPETQNLVLQVASTVVNYTATVTYPAGTPAFVKLPSPSGSVSPGSANGGIVVGVNPEPAGVYYALVTVTPAQTFNEISPLQFTIVYNVVSTPVVDVQPAGVVIVAKANATPAAASVNLQGSTNTAVQYTVGATGNFFDLSANVPNPNTISGNVTQAVPIRVDSVVNPGIYKGMLDINFGAPLNVTRQVDVEYIVVPATATITARSGVHADATTGCTATKIGMISSTLAGNFTQPAGWPAVYSVRVLDDCANVVTNASVTMSFSNGDPPLSALLTDSTTGTYAATWVPNRPSALVTVTARAVAGTMVASTTTSGNVPANATVPIVATNGVLNNLNPQVAAPLAPGTISAVYGTSLASGTGSPGQVPLPKSFQATSVMIAGLSAPIYYTSPGQLNVQLPAELIPNQPYTLLVANGNAYSVPQDVIVTDVAPGVAAFNDGTMAIIAQHSDFTLVDATHPAKPGETLVMYLDGLGATTPAVASGAAAPSTAPLAAVTNPVTVTVDGNAAAVIFAGLTPGAVGLYQINFTVPAAAQSGNLKVVVKQNGVTANVSLLPVATN